MDIFRQKIERMVKKEVKSGFQLEIPPDASFGDYALPCFSFAREFRKNPNDIAQDLAKKIKLEKPISRIAVKGPYINFFINKPEMAELTIQNILKEKDNYGKTKKKKEKIMVEFSSPNTNKPQHLGHVRNNILGDCISRIREFAGDNVIKTSLINDRGIHICQSMLAYKKWGKNKKPDVKGDFFVGKFYVMFCNKARENPALEGEAQEMLKKWEKGDKEVRALWKKMNSWVLKGFEETYKNLGISFDKIYYESSIYKKGKDIISDGLKKGIFKKEDNAIVADLEKHGLPKKVLMRADGTSLYMSQDIYLAKLKFGDFKLDKSVYVVASEQNMHFQQLFKILKLLGFKWADKCVHLSYGMVYLPEGKMKSREGKVIDADDLIREMKELARFEIKERHKDLKESEIKKRSEIIGLGALKFHMLKTDLIKDMHYDPEESISFEGETGPYVQYVHARCSSILRKAKEMKVKIGEKADFSLLKHAKEIELVRLLNSFPDVVNEASTHYRPSNIARYLIDLSKAFNNFYHDCPVLQVEEDLRKLRLLLVISAKQVIKNSLNLMGIEAPEEM